MGSALIEISFYYHDPSPSISRKEREQLAVDALRLARVFKKIGFGEYLVRYHFTSPFLCQVYYCPIFGLRIKDISMIYYQRQTI